MIEKNTKMIYLFIFIIHIYVCVYIYIYIYIYIYTYKSLSCIPDTNTAFCKLTVLQYKNKEWQ